jgi:hypothetical protein
VHVFASGSPGCYCRRLPPVTGSDASSWRASHRTSGRYSSHTLTLLIIIWSSPYRSNNDGRGLLSVALFPLYCFPHNHTVSAVRNLFSQNAWNTCGGRWRCGSTYFQRRCQSGQPHAVAALSGKRDPEVSLVVDWEGHLACCAVWDTVCVCVCARHD